MEALQERRVKCVWAMHDEERSVTRTLLHLYLHIEHPVYVNPVANDPRATGGSGGGRPLGRAVRRARGNEWTRRVGSNRTRDECHA